MHHKTMITRYEVEFNEYQSKYYVIDNKGNIYGMLTGFTSEKDALNWIEADRVAPRLKCSKCKRIWQGVKVCPICTQTDEVLASIGASMKAKGGKL